MQLKQEANTEPRKRFHLFSRLRKAVKHAEELEHLCDSNCVDAKTKLEAQVKGSIDQEMFIEVFWVESTYLIAFVSY